MRFLLDANVRRSIGLYLQSAGHDVHFLAGTTDRSLPDQDVLTLAQQEKRILMTNDKDFGNLIFQQQHAPHGIILLRLTHETSERYCDRITQLLSLYGERLEGHFVVVTDFHFRFR